MSIHRPPPRRRASLDSATRGVLLRACDEGLTVDRKAVPSLNAHDIWSIYTSAQLIPMQLDQGIAEVGRRYGISDLDRRVFERLKDHVNGTEIMGLAPYPDMANQQIERAARAIGAVTTLDLLPDEEFLTAIEDAARWMEQRGRLGTVRSAHIRETAERVFRAYGLPYVVREDRIEWVGDDVTRREVIEPGLVALDDARLSGARAEFALARVALRTGTSDSLRDATHEAGNAVEATLHALIDSHRIARPRAKTAAPLFNCLRDARVLPPSLEHTVMAAPQLRNAQGGHSQGPTVSDADRRLAESAVSAAAVAISALAAYLP